MRLTFLCSIEGIEVRPLIKTRSISTYRRAARAFAPLCLFWVLCHPAAGQPAAPRDGQHDFDFGSGTWHTHIKRTLDPFDDKSPSIELDGSVSSRKVWGGRAWLEEIQADGPKGHWQAMTLFLYNPQAHQWSMNFINSKMGTLNSPLIGEFKGG